MPGRRECVGRCVRERGRRRSRLCDVAVTRGLQGKFAGKTRGRCRLVARAAAGVADWRCRVGVNASVVSRRVEAPTYPAAAGYRERIFGGGGGEGARPWGKASAEAATARGAGGGARRTPEGTARAARPRGREGSHAGGRVGGKAIAARGGGSSSA